jgi:hypothetical protein
MKLLFPIILMAVLIPTAIGAAVLMVSNRISGSFTVASAMKLTWISGDPNTAVFIPGYGQSMQIKVENPSTATYSNCNLDLSVQAPAAVADGLGTGIEIMYQLPNAPNSWIELKRDNAQASSYYYIWHMNLPTMPPGSVYLANCSIYFWNNPPMPTGSYNYDITIKQTIA